MQTESRKKVIIVGGVAAGMSTAARLRRLDEKAEIIVFERSQYVSFANCGLPYHIGGDIQQRQQLIVQTPQSLAESLNLNVRPQHEVLSIDSQHKQVLVVNLTNGEQFQQAYDQLVVCPGAKPIRPDWPGIQHERIVTLRNIEDMDRIKALLNQDTQRVCIIGGGYIGIEMAENLRHLGKQVSLVERSDQIMRALDAEMTAPLKEKLAQQQIQILFNSEVKSFQAHQHGLQINIQSLLDNSTSHLEADLVILAIGVKPDVAWLKNSAIKIGERGGILVNQHMQTSVPDIYAAGDAVEVQDKVTAKAALIPLAGPANRQGRIVADNICGIASSYQATQGTAIIKVFDMTAAATGASEANLLAAGIDYQKIYLHPYGHASYYPGTQVMSIKLLFNQDGKILGAQAVGYDGVDKRIDVLATAIYAGLTVYDLEHLELSYAPPYGSAKDPVNMAGFIASNVLQDRIRFIHAEQWTALSQQSLIVDVRGEQEFAQGHIAGAINIPLKDLRNQLASLPKDKPIILYCMVGLRSYIAYRLLCQHGFEALTTLSGGYKTYLAWGQR
jgi:NADPH-dependent 2,4-dienoyl-CoA reductase/sulfur reductase-like enzyme/rhodanese-related sulfurtransferase